jgi:hypothetical protein
MVKTAWIVLGDRSNNPLERLGKANVREVNRVTRTTASSLLYRVAASVASSEAVKAHGE